MGSKKRLPQMAGGSASALSLSRPAQASLTLRPVGLLNRLKWPLSRGSSPSGYPAEPLVSYQINRQLSGWNLPPLVIPAFGAHCQEETSPLHNNLMPAPMPDVKHDVGLNLGRQRSSQLYARNRQNLADHCEGEIGLAFDDVRGSHAGNASPARSWGQKRQSGPKIKRRVPGAPIGQSNPAIFSSVRALKSRIRLPTISINSRFDTILTR